ncbi:MAG: ABC transporter substrate-binding protein [Chloroflexota bacterium]|nr:ABC transporter substrate-binding protein [Dehalococcoidia bacterium]MDW8253906.1 ABC transporter substrate-binding protein [Chloroflexota bacterium]
MNPLLASDSYSRGYAEMVYNAPLLRMNPETLEWDTKDGAAESFELSPDGLIIRYRLKPNLQWSDGTPITSADYLFTFEKMLDPAVDYPFRANLAFIAGARAPDPRTIEFTFREPFCPAIEYTNINPIPKHIFEHLNINDNPENLRPTVGSGPWLLREWVRDSHATFVANEKFYLGRPYLDTYTIRIVRTSAVAFSLLKNGEVDQVSLRPDEWEEAKRLPHVTTISFYPAGSSWVYIGFNLRSPLVSDLRVRQAFAAAVPRQEMIERIRLGRARLINSIYGPSSWAHDPTLQGIDYDPERARRLLDEAGWRTPPGNPSGIRQKDGRELKLRLFYNVSNRDAEQVAVITQAALRQIGVDLQVIGEELSTLLNRTNRTRDLEMWVNTWISPIEPHSRFNAWKSSDNATGFADPVVDELFARAASVPGCKIADRAPIYHEIQRRIAAEVPYIFLWEIELLYGVNNRIVTNPVTSLGFWYREWEWYSKTGK